MKLNIVRFKTEMWRVRNFVFFTALESLASLAFLFALPKSANEVWAFGYSPSRILMMLSVFFLTLMLAWLTVNLFRKPAWEQKIETILVDLAANPRRTNLVLTVLSAGFVCLAFFLILWMTTRDNYYQGYLLRFSPILVFGTLVIIQMLGMALSQLSKQSRMEWLWSFLFAVLLLFSWEYPLTVFNKLGNIFLVLTALFATFYVQMLFRSAFGMPIKNKIGWVIAVVAIPLLLYAQIFFIPKKFLLHSQSFFIYGPVALLLLVASQQVLERLLSAFVKSAIMTVALYLAIFAGFIYVGNAYYLVGKAHAEQVNITYAPYDDEEAYISFALKARETNFRYTGERNQMPLYPFIQALFYRSPMSLNDFFINGKLVNVFLSLALLVLIFFVAAKLFTPFPAISLTLTAAFGLYVFKSGYFMVELLYYTLSSMAYLLLCLMLIKPSVKLGMAAGVILGLAHLSKASVLPALLLFIGVYVAKEVFFLYSQFKSHSLNLREILSALTPRLAGVGLVVIFYLIVISPYIIESKKIYGSYFYNVNSTFYMWYDSYEEAIQGTIAHGDRIGWPDMPDKDIPGPLKYFREHGFLEIWERIKYGSHWQLENLRYQYGFFNYPILFMGFALILLLLNANKNLSLFREKFPLILFSVLYFALYILLYIWYSPIACLPRFIYALYVPLLFSVFAAAKSAVTDISLPLTKLANLTLLVMICVDIWYIISWGPFNRDFGS